MKNLIFLSILAIVSIGCQSEEKTIIKFEKTPYSIWDDYGVVDTWKKYGRGAGVKVAILEHDFDLSVQLPYEEAIDFYCKKRDWCEPFDYVSNNPSHGTEMWSILAEVAPEAEIYLLRHYGAWDLSSLEEALAWCEHNNMDIIASAVLIANYTETLEQWWNKTEIDKIFIASPPSYQDLYAGLYTHPKTIVVGIQNRDGEMSLNRDEDGYWTTSNKALVNLWILENHIMSTTLGGQKRQVFGTSPATFVAAGLEACRQTKSE